jgi:ADP-heptose:LPS heptosyltransferase
MGLLPDRTALLKAADATVGALLGRLLGYIHAMRHRTAMPEGPLSLDSIRRILVIRPGGMGDMIILLPVLRTIRERFPDAVIDLVCEKRNVDVLKLREWESNALTYDSHPFRFLCHLRRRRYDLAIDTEQFHHFSAIFALLSGAPVRIGFKVNPIRNPLYSHLVNYELDGPEGRQFVRLLEPLGIAQPSYVLENEIRDFSVPIPPEVEAKIGPLSASGGFAILNPGSSHSYKLWPKDRFVELAGRLHKDHGLAVVLTGVRAEEDRNEAILQKIREAGGTAISLTGQLTLGQTAATMKRARLFVGSDSGLSHLAVALGAASVTIFGPSDPKKWGFENGKHATVRRELPCAPCFIFGYHRPCRTIACMSRITADDVMAACRKVL